jgi:hypothetical protein
MCDTCVACLGAMSHERDIVVLHLLVPRAVSPVVTLSEAKGLSRWPSRYPNETVNLPYHAYGGRRCYWSTSLTVTIA